MQYKTFESSFCLKFNVIIAQQLSVHGPGLSIFSLKEFSEKTVHGSKLIKLTFPSCQTEYY